MSTLYIVKVGDFTCTFTDKYDAEYRYSDYVKKYPNDKIELLEYKEPPNTIEQHLPEERKLTKVTRCCRCSKSIEYGDPIFLLQSNAAPDGYAKHAYFCSRLCAEQQIVRADTPDYVYKNLPEWVEE